MFILSNECIIKMYILTNVYNNMFILTNEYIMNVFID